MPVYLNRVPPGHELSKHTKVLRGNPPVEFRGSQANCLDIGIINNMPDGALKSTERQFLSLLDSAAEGMVVHVTFYALPDVPRSDSGQRHVSSFHSRIENLWDRHLDGLIVTGAEPRTPSLTEEPYWPSLTSVFEWAEENTHSAIWSCLAAHAALLHIDGIDRRRLRDKRFGLFECDRVADHQLMTGIAPRLMMPHSRWNDVSERDLTACGYRVLTRSMDAGVDTFVKQRKSLFVFFQGHPEYEANTLLLEYRRDIGRYLRRERDTYPGMPQGYFDASASATLTALRERALLDPREELLADLPTALLEGHLANRWHSVASRFYRNWLMRLCALKERPLNGWQPRKESARERDVVSPRRFIAGAD